MNTFVRRVRRCMGRRSIPSSAPAFARRVCPWRERGGWQGARITKARGVDAAQRLAVTATYLGQQSAAQRVRGGGLRALHSAVPRIIARTPWDVDQTLIWCEHITYQLPSTRETIFFHYRSGG